jgi:hypothetical protein
VLVREPNSRSQPDFNLEVDTRGVTPVPPGIGVVRRVAKVFGDRMVGLLFVLLWKEVVPRVGQPPPLLRAWDSATRKAALPVVVMSGNVPPWPAPDQVTVQCTVAVTGNAWPAWLADEVR